MEMFNRMKSAWNALTRPTVSMDDAALLEWLGIDKNTPKKELNEVTYFTCMKMLSETMGKLPLKYYQHTGKGKIRAEPNRAAYLLMNRPNRIMTPATFWGTVEFNCEHYGNAYVWMQTQFVKNGRFGGEYQILSFWVMQSNYVEVIMDDVGVFGESGYLYYRYSDQMTGKSYVFRQDNVLHFKTWCSENGIMGKSVKSILQDTIKGANESQGYLNNLYSSGLTAAATLQYAGELDKQRRTALQKEYNDLLSGARNAGKVVAVPIGFTLQPLNIKLSDAQFFELKKYSALQIAAAFGIKPNQLNNYDKSSYSNSETQQLAFLVDTMAYRLSQYEQEINYKCLTPKESKDGFYFKFNEKAILRTDSKTQRENIVAYLQNGVYSVNDALDLLDKPYVDGGDIHMVNGTYQPLTAVGAAYGVQPEQSNTEGVIEIEVDVRGDIISNDDKWIYDWLEWDATCPADIKNALNTKPEGEKLTVLVNSGGGSVMAGQEIYSLLNGRDDVEIKVQSLAGSAASVIAMANTSEISPVAMIMIHNVSMYGAGGDYHDMQKNAEILKQMNAALASAYSSKTGKSEEEILKLMDRETWLTANQALEMGFVDKITDTAQMFTNNISGMRLTDEIRERVLVEKKAKLKNEELKNELLQDLDLYGV